MTSGPERLALRSDDDYRLWIARHETPAPPEVPPGAPPLSLVLLLAQPGDAPDAPDPPGSFFQRVRRTAEATGAFVAFLLPGDALAPGAARRVAAALLQDPAALILYGDDDRLDGAGRRAAPSFKTAWDPDALLAADLFAGLALFRATLLAEARRETDLLDRAPTRAHAAAARYALALRLAALAQPDQVVHVPHILCHRRDDEDAAAAEAPLRLAVLRRFLDETCPGATARPGPHGTNRVVWPVPDPPPRVTAIVPTRDRADLLERCADGLLRLTDYGALDLVVVDNGSTRPDALALLARLATDRRVRVLRDDGPFDHSRMNNRAAAVAAGEVLVLLNDDVEILDPAWLREMVGHALRPDVGAVGAKLLFADGRLQHGGVTFAPGPVAKHVLEGAPPDAVARAAALASPREFSAVTAACLAIRRAVFREVGGFDAAAFPTSYNDVDLCFRLADRGYRILWTPFATLVHHGSASRPRLVTEAACEADRADLARLRRRWPGEMENDPFTPPSLRLHDTHEILLVTPR